MIRFTVPGRPVGYVRAGHGKSKWSRSWKRYTDYRDRIARYAGRHLETCGGLSADGIKVRVDTMTYFASDAASGVNARPDSDNVWKAVTDRLFKQDRYCYGLHDFAFDRENPRVEVLITWEDENV